MAGHFVSAGVKTIEQSCLSLRALKPVGQASRLSILTGQSPLSFPQSAPSPSLYPLPSASGGGEEKTTPISLSFPFVIASKAKQSRFSHPILSLVLFLLLITPSLSFASCCVDFDGDGYSDHKSCRSGTDCDDRDWFIHPGTLGCNNCKDVDDDGYFAHDLLDCSLGDDLDDNDPGANPGKDDGGGNGGGGCSSVVWYKDVDDDKYSPDGVPPLTQCDQPPGYKPVSDIIQTSGDCKDDPSVEPLAYKINPGAEEVCDDWEIDNNCDGTIDEGCCEGWINTLPPKEVRPKDTGGITKANVIIGLNKPAPPKGCNVSLVVEPEKKSGGHEHDSGRPKGTLSKDTLLFREGETDTQSPIYYTSSAISGIEKIKAEFKESKKSEKTAETTITVKVPELINLPSSMYYRFWGWTPKHHGNHYGLSGTNEKIALMAQDFYNQFNATLGIDDMSLELGGGFDIYGRWLDDITRPQCLQKDYGHCSHRTGTSVDISGTAVGRKGSVTVIKRELEKICNKRGGTLAKEGPIHCEF